jgi:2'-5' RNA ligase
MIRKAASTRGVTIVALPRKEEYVWKISSEEKPHLTLLFLGDQVENFDRVVQYVEHAVSTSLTRFMLDVDRRDTLGEYDADVLFFGDYGLDKLRDFRAQLLTDPNIRKAYDSAEQFPEWLPHLTLGYPDAPAKPDSRDYPGIGWVAFDRIAVWDGEYEGVELPLSESRGADEVKMTAALGKQFLEHYGVKGMKWGVIRNRVAGAVKEVYAPSEDAVSAGKHMTKAKFGGVRSLSNKEMRHVIARMELEQRYRDLYGERQYHDEAVSRAKRYAKRGARWAGRLFTDILRDGGASWIKRPGSNASGQTSAHVRAWTTGQQFANVIEGSFSERRAIGR